MRAALAALVLLLPGCLDGAGRGPAIPRLEGWDGGESLLAHLTARQHSGGFDAYAYPRGDLPEPAWCLAFRADRSHAQDTCDITHPGDEGWLHPIDNPPWGVHAHWIGRGRDTADEPDPDLPRLIVAYDADGLPAAHWSGALHPQAAHMTE